MCRGACGRLMALPSTPQHAEHPRSQKAKACGAAHVANWPTVKEACWDVKLTVGSETALAVILLTACLCVFPFCNIQISHVDVYVVLSPLLLKLCRADCVFFLNSSEERISPLFIMSLCFFNMMSLSITTCWNHTHSEFRASSISNTYRDGKKEQREKENLRALSQIKAQSNMEWRQEMKVYLEDDLTGTPEGVYVCVWRDTHSRVDGNLVFLKDGKLLVDGWNLTFYLTQIFLQSFQKF